MLGKAPSTDLFVCQGCGDVARLALELKRTPKTFAEHFAFGRPLRWLSAATLAGASVRTLPVVDSNPVNLLALLDLSCILKSLFRSRPVNTGQCRKQSAVQAKLRNFLFSLPERGVRSATALAGGLLRELGEVSIPQTIRRGQLYRNLVDATLRFLIEQVGQVEGVYPGEELLSKDFLVRRAAGNGIEMAGILAFRASPVWVLAALADASGAGRYLIREIAASLKDEGLLESTAQFTTVDEMLDGLEASAGRMAETVNTPPLDIHALRQEWSALRQDLSKIPPRRLPTMHALRGLWSDMKQEAQKQNQTVFRVSSLMAMSAVANVPAKARWLSASARLAARKAGASVAARLLEDYRTTLKRIRETGYVRYAARQFRPYLSAAVSQFSRRRTSLTEKLLARYARARRKRKTRRHR